MLHEILNLDKIEMLCFLLSFSFYFHFTFSYESENNIYPSFASECVEETISFMS